MAKVLILCGLINPQPSQEMRGITEYNGCSCYLTRARLKYGSVFNEIISYIGLVRFVLIVCPIKNQQKIGIRQKLSTE